MVSLGQKLKMPKTCEKPFHKNMSFCVQKTARKKIKYWRNETILKIGLLAKAIAHAKAIAISKWSDGQFVSKIKNAKNMRKIILQEHNSCSEQKTARKNIKYWRNETILKIGHLAKAIAHAKAIVFSKWSVWIKN